MSLGDEAADSDPSIATVRGGLLPRSDPAILAYVLIGPSTGLPDAPATSHVLERTGSIPIVSSAGLGSGVFQPAPPSLR